MDPSVLFILPYSCLTPKLVASSLSICPMWCTANWLLESLQFTVCLLSSLNLRKEGHSSPLGAIFKVCFSICIFDFFPSFPFHRWVFPSQVLGFLTDFGDRALLHVYTFGLVFITLLEGSLSILVRKDKYIYLKDQQDTKLNSAFCPNSQHSGDKCSEARSRVFTSVLNSCFT